MEYCRVTGLEMWMARLQLGSWGATPIPHEELRRPRESATKLNPDPEQPPAIQIAEARVDGHEVVVAYLHQRPLVEPEWRQLVGALRLRFNLAPVLAVLEASAGVIRVDGSFCRDHRERTFLAAAVLQRSWAWDESEVIRIREGETETHVEAALQEDGVWKAAVLR